MDYKFLFVINIIQKMFLYTKLNFLILLCDSHFRFTSNELASTGLYEQKGVILTEVLNPDSDKIMEDAIEVGAEEAEKMHENNVDFIKVTESFHLHKNHEIANIYSIIKMFHFSLRAELQNSSRCGRI